MKKEISIHRSYKGQYQVEKLNKNGEVIFASPWFDNIITDVGLDLYASPSASLSLRYCVVGTGTSTPLVTDTSLENQIAQSELASSTVPASIVEVGPPLRAYNTTTYNFGLGDVVGNITEVGVTTAGGTLYSRALFKDGVGNPTSITVLADEQLRIQYRLYVLIPDVDVNDTVDGYDLIIRPSRYNSSSANMRWNPQAAMKSTGGNNTGNFYTGDILPSSTDSLPSGSVSTGGTSTLTTYVPGSFELIDTLYFPTDTANGSLRTWVTTGNTSVGFYNCFWAIQFDPAITKTSDDVLTIVLRYTWGRAS